VVVDRDSAGVLDARQGTNLGLEMLNEPSLPERGRVEDFNATTRSCGSSTPRHIS
jgi:hypothetical protein